MQSDDYGKDIMNEKINYDELKNSIISGCNAYLSARKNGTSLQGFYHGEQGQIRASKAKTYASRILNNNIKDHSLLLALLLAIFNSSSKGLAMCIAAQLIAGEITIMNAIKNGCLDFSIVTENTLKSLAFSPKMVNNAAVFSLIEKEDTPFSLTLGLDKTQCVRWILNRQAPELVFFKNLTKTFEAALEDSKSSEIDSSMLNTTLMR